MPVIVVGPLATVSAPGSSSSTAAPPSLVVITLQEPSQSIPVGGIFLPLYRIFMIVTAAVIGIVLWLVMEKTRIGAQVRATVDDAQMARGIGIDTSRISMGIFERGEERAFHMLAASAGDFLGPQPRQ